MKRRYVIKVGSTLLLPLAGCGRFEGQPTPDRQLDFQQVSVYPDDEGYQLTLDVVLGRSPQIEIENITIYCYSHTGKKICQKSVEDNSLTETIELHCSSFPEIITADAATSVCDDLNIPIVYWVGSSDQQQKRIPEDLDDNAVVWQQTWRRCGESLPPERVLRNTTTGD